MEHLLKLGQSAPLFTAMNHHKETVNLADFRNKKNVVLYFYPKASTPGCTVQACGMRDSLEQFSALDTVVLALSPDTVPRLQSFASKYQLNFDLLSDVGHVIADTYGVWGPKKMAGRDYVGLIRTSFVIDKKGVIKHIIRKVKTKSHHNDVLALLISNT